MKITPSALRSDIEDAATAGLLGRLPPAVAEKDIHITDALRELAGIRLTHDAHQINRAKGDTRPATLTVGTHLVFAGGTCLSKAHGLIERMSEDIDIKVVLDRVPDGYALAKGHSDRKRLGDLHDEVERRLTALGFEYVRIETGSNPFSRDNRRYYCLAVSYRASFQDVSGALRPQLKLELVHRPPVLPVQRCEMGYLLDRFVSRASPLRFVMSCMSVEETLAEKVLSMLRRCAWKWDGYQRAEFDTTLVRHLYDIWRIDESGVADVTLANSIFSAIAAKDAQEFRGQHPEFDEQPIAVLRRTLASMRTNDALPRYFEQRLIPLVFADTTPHFDECMASFAGVAEQFVSTDMQPVETA